jgi:short chain dehydrogenase
MTGRVEGKVAFITGAARGQGRSHAVTLAREGADIIAVDLCAQVGSVPYPMATPQDLAQTVKEVEAAGRRIVATVADVRDYDALKEALDDGVAQLGRLDIVSANAGITSYGRAEDLAEQTWQDVIDVDLTGVWHAVKAAIPHLRAGGRGGSIIVTSSDLGLKAAAKTFFQVSWVRGPRPDGGAGGAGPRRRGGGADHHLGLDVRQRPGLGQPEDPRADRPGGHRAVRAAGRRAAAVAGRLRPDRPPAGPARAEHGRGGPARTHVLRRLRPVGRHPPAARMIRPMISRG